MSIDFVSKQSRAYHLNKMKEALMVSASHPNVIIFTTPNCPDCQMLKAWLRRKGIAFEERDLTSPKIMAEAPITLVGEQVFYGTFSSQKRGLSEALGLSLTTRKSAP